MKKKNIFVILAIILIVVICGLIFWKYSKSNNEEIANPNNETEIPAQKIDSNAIKQANLESENTEEKANYVEGQAIVVSNESLESLQSIISNSSELQDVKIENNVEVNNDDTTNKTNIFLVSSEKYTTEELREKLKNSGIDSAPNFVTHIDNITNDTYINYQWGLENNGQNGGTNGLDINPIETSNDEEKVIVVVDTGVDYTHSDLSEVMWTDTNGNHGYDYVNNDSEPIDDNGHGTHCAGIIAGSAGTVGGVSGAVLEASNIKILALKTLDDAGSGDIYNAIEAYTYIDSIMSDVNIVAINNSWTVSTAGFTDEEIASLETIFADLNVLIESVGTKGALSICAAGNETSDNDSVKVFPACLENDYIITVSASNVNDELSDFSNYGATSSDIAAPGSNILSTVSYNVFNPSIYTESKRNTVCSVYEDFEDTTFATGDLLMTDGSLYLNNEMFFGNKGESSLEWRIEGATADSQYCLLIPLTDITNANEYFSIMYNYIGPSSSSGTILITYCDSEFNNYIYRGSDGEYYYFSYGSTNTITNESSTQWVHTTDKINYTDGYITIMLIPYTDGDFSIFIDDFGISNPNVTEDDFEKYEFYDGTSMATPYVTGAVGSLSNKYNEATSLELKNIILASVRTSNNLTGKVSTGGVLDLDKTPVPTLDLPTNESDAVWNKSTIEGTVNETIELQNTMSGIKYEYSLDNGNTWELCTYDEVNKKWLINITSEGIYHISVRELNGTKFTGEYIYKIDSNRPRIAVITTPDENNNPSTMEVIITDSLSSMPDNQSIEYVFSQEEPNEYTSWSSVVLDEENKAYLELPTENGTYNLYIKSVTDISGWKSSDETMHIFESYTFEKSTQDLTNEVSIT